MKKNEKTALDIIHEKKQSCYFAGQPASRWLMYCMRDFSKKRYCYKVCEHFKPVESEETVIKNPQVTIMPMYGCPSIGFKPKIDIVDSNSI